MKSKLGKGIMLVLVANLINLVFNLLTNLVLPKHLSVESYAAIKTYQLYMTYIGIMHFGYNDGIYLKYGGKSINKIDKEKIAGEVSNIRFFLLFITLIGGIISYRTNQWIILMVVIALLPTNMLSFFQFLYQACGEFKFYGRIINCVSVGTFLINSILIFRVSADSYIIYLCSYVILNVCVWVITEIYFKKKIGVINISHFSIIELLKNMKNGILLTLGNFSSIIMTTMDRWMVSIFVGTIGFAQYSFAVSMENFLNTAITPITVTLYNHFCQNDSSKENKKLKELVIVFASIIVSAAFPVKFILEVYLRDYFSSLHVLFLLFASQLFYVVIKGIYVNLYKARKQQRKYFIDLLWVILVGFFANIVIYALWSSKEAFATATLISSMFWLLKCHLYFKDMTFKEILFMIMEMSIFLILGFYFNSIVGFIIYIISTAIFIRLLLPQTFRNIVNKVKGNNLK